MSYKLKKPYTEIEGADFIVLHNHQNNRKIEETETALFALEANEIMVNGKPVIDPDYEEKQKQAEEERIANLKMTALDFLKVLYSLGLTREQVHAYLDSHPEVDEQLKYCQNVYCGVVTRLCPITVDDKTITKEMIEQAFKNNKERSQH